MNGTLLIVSVFWSWIMPPMTMVCPLRTATWLVAMRLPQTCSLNPGVAASLTWPVSGP